MQTNLRWLQLYIGRNILSVSNEVMCTAKLPQVWVQGSGMPAVHVHLSGRDVDDAILKANGFTKPESKPTIPPRESTICQVDNIETLVEDKLRAMMMKLLA